MNDAPGRRRWWTQEEDHILHEEVKHQTEHGSQGPRNWSAIAEKLPGRSNKDCRKRWTKISLSSRKGTWSGAEDHLLRKAVAKFGFQWTKVAGMVGSRHPDQCAKRWHHSLDPNVKRGPWASDEDGSLINAVQRIGRDWKEIGRELFPNRSTTDIKNRYVILSRRQGFFSSQDDCSAINLKINADSPPLADSKPVSHNSGDVLTPNGDTDASFLPTPCDSAADLFHLPPDALTMTMPRPTVIPPYPSLPCPHANISTDDPTISWDVNDWALFDRQYLLTPGPSELEMESCDPSLLTNGNGTTPDSALLPPEIPGPSTLVLEDLRPETVNLVIDTLLRTNSKFGMRLYNTGS
ncbi:uncharacterized protein DSM5745_06851 [Aspergillus mulundensis]|uniref:Uncharacterized protein n=1 Tax=Aspergillus mulundensis TaxID=1810919 RepID=A0A3D8RS42_9EURO|nr:Uncharacterized protein DSM5745_06851 [Aspergillus mulundensis]RDW76859.1 Uncharacterized protein DSM5745_06851 [Aspergillus mulundensis]